MSSYRRERQFVYCMCGASIIRQAGIHEGRKKGGLTGSD